jgi:hypothetical protein
MDESIKESLEIERLAVKDGLQTIGSDAEKQCTQAMDGVIESGKRPPRHKFLQIRLEQLEKEVRLHVEQRRISGLRAPQLLDDKYIEELRQVLHKLIDDRCNRLRSLTENQKEIPSRSGGRGGEASRLKEIADGLLKQMQLTPRAQPLSVDGPLVFISCGQFTQEEMALGKAVEKLVQELTGVKAYFAENQNTLQALSENVFSSLKRATGFIAIMHHRGAVETPSGKHVRGSVWVEQEIAIAAFLRFSTGEEIPVALYMQQDENGVGIKREGVRDKLRLDPVSFQTSDDVLSNLRERILSGQFNPRKTTGQPRSPKQEALYSKAKAALDKLGESARLVIRHLQNVGEFRSGSMYDDPVPNGITGAKMREMLELLRQEDLVAETMVEGPQPHRLFKIAPGMKAVLEDLV